MNKLFNLLLAQGDPGVLDPIIKAHWAFYLGGAICIVLLALVGWLTYKAFVNKNNFYDVESDKWFWLKNFWHKNRIGFYIMLDIILAICIIVFFMAGAGALE